MLNPTSSVTIVEVPAPRLTPAAIPKFSDAEGKTNSSAAARADAFISPLKYLAPNYISSSFFLFVLMFFSFLPSFFSTPFPILERRGHLVRHPNQFVAVDGIYFVMIKNSAIPHIVKNLEACPLARAREFSPVSQHHYRQPSRAPKSR